MSNSSHFQVGLSKHFKLKKNLVYRIFEAWVSDTSQGLVGGLERFRRKLSGSGTSILDVGPSRGTLSALGDDPSSPVKEEGINWGKQATLDLASVGKLTPEILHILLYGILDSISCSRVVRFGHTGIIVFPPPRTGDHHDWATGSSADASDSLLYASVEIASSLEEVNEDKLIRVTLDGLVPLPCLSRIDDHETEALAAGSPIQLVPYNVPAYFLNYYKGPESALQSLHTMFRQSLSGRGCREWESRSMKYVLAVIVLAPPSPTAEKKTCTLIYPLSLILRVDPSLRPPLAQSEIPKLPSQLEDSPALATRPPVSRHEVPDTLPPGPTLLRHSPSTRATLHNTTHQSLSRTAHEVSTYVDGVAREREKEKQHRTLSRSGSANTGNTPGSIPPVPTSMQYLNESPSQQRATGSYLSKTMSLPPMPEELMLAQSFYPSPQSIPDPWSPPSQIPNRDNPPAAPVIHPNTQDQAYSPIREPSVDPPPLSSASSTGEIPSLVNAMVMSNSFMDDVDWMMSMEDMDMQLNFLTSGTSVYRTSTTLSAETIAPRSDLHQANAVTLSSSLSARASGPYLDENASTSTRSFVSRFGQASHGQSTHPTGGQTFDTQQPSSRTVDDLMLTDDDFSFFDVQVDDPSHSSVSGVVNAPVTLPAFGASPGSSLDWTAGGRTGLPSSTLGDGRMHSFFSPTVHTALGGAALPLEAPFPAYEFQPLSSPKPSDGSAPAPALGPMDLSPSLPTIPTAPTFDPLVFPESITTLDEKYSSYGKFGQAKHDVSPSVKGYDGWKNAYDEQTDPRIGMIKRLRALGLRQRSGQSGASANGNEKTVAFHSALTHEVERWRSFVDVSQSDDEEKMSISSSSGTSSSGIDSDEEAFRFADDQNDIESPICTPADPPMIDIASASAHTQKLPSYIPPGPACLEAQFEYTKLLEIFDVPASFGDFASVGMTRPPKEPLPSAAPVIGIPTPVSPSALAQDDGTNEMEAEAMQHRKDLEKWARVLALKVVECWEHFGKLLSTEAISPSAMPSCSDHEDDAKEAKVCRWKNACTASSVKDVDVSYLKQLLQTCQFLRDVCEDDGPTSFDDLLLPRLPPCTVLVASKELQLIEVLPTALRFWNKSQLFPKYGRKNAIVYAVLLGDQGLAEHEVSAKQWLKGLVAAYQNNHFGTLTPGMVSVKRDEHQQDGGGDGVVVVDGLTEFGTFFHLVHHQYLRAAEENRLPTILTLVLPPDQISPTSIVLQGIFALFSSLPSNTPHIQIIPYLLPTFALSSPPLPSASPPPSILGSLYNQILIPVKRRAGGQHIFKNPLREEWKLVQGFSCVLGEWDQGESEKRGLAARFERREKCSVAIGERDMIVHIGYRVVTALPSSLSDPRGVHRRRRWLTSYAVDERGEKTDIGVWMIPYFASSSPNLAALNENEPIEGEDENAWVARVLWDFLVQFVAGTDVQWRVVFAKLSCEDDKCWIGKNEVDAWITHLNSAMITTPGFIDAQVSLVSVGIKRVWAFPAVASRAAAIDAASDEETSISSSPLYVDASTTTYLLKRPPSHVLVSEPPVRVVEEIAEQWLKHPSHEVHNVQANTEPLASLSLLRVPRYPSSTSAIHSSLMSPVELPINLVHIHTHPDSQSRQFPMPDPEELIQKIAKNWHSLSILTDARLPGLSSPSFAGGGLDILPLHLAGVFVASIVVRGV